MTISLFDPDGQWLKPPRASLFWHSSYLAQSRADSLLVTLLAELDWQQGRVHLFGKDHQEPRLSSYYGDTGSDYSYANRAVVPAPWHPALAALRQQLSEAFSSPFNAVLCNLYRNGQDCMGWHSDDEPELGPQPTIASVSLGATRRFRLRDKQNPKLQQTFELNHGSLLIMAGTTQRYWQHSLAKAQKIQSPRINLTFRYVTPKCASSPA
ncbi:MAG TPA: alpha-ketoglutarate-dependent dioxygenase AlkB [Marinagarivorans sp.]